MPRKSNIPKQKIINSAKSLSQQNQLASLISKGLAFHHQRKFSDAQAMYEQVLVIQVNHFDALQLLGALSVQTKEFIKGVNFLTKALQIKPNDATCYSNRGIALKELGRFEESLADYDKAISIKADYADAHFNRGNALKELQRFEEALADYDKAISIKADYADAHFNRGNALKEIQRFEEALSGYDKAISIRANYVEAHLNRGNVLNKLLRFEEALTSYDKTIRIKADYVEAHLNRGNVLNKLLRFEEALTSFDKTIQIKAGYADAHFNRGNALKELQRFEEALASYDETIRIKHDYAEAYYNRGNTLISIGLHKEAQNSYNKALSINPDFSLARWAHAISVLPIIQSDLEHSQSSRTEFFKELTIMHTWFMQDRLEEGYKVIGSVQPFYLAYQEENNKELLTKYGELCCKLMEYWQQKENYLIKPKTFNKPIKLGIVSKHIHQHSVWDALTRGWIEQMDRDRFQLYFFYTGFKVDQETKFAKSIATGFFTGINDLDSWVNAVLDAQIDILLYPEIGMDPMTVKLASLRLAPVQVGSWGHPETTGLPTIDYYLSANLLEPANSEKNYTEKLIRLPNLGCFYKKAPVDPIPIDLEKFKIDANQPLLICPGAPFKYQPQHDHIFVEIAKRLGRCQFIFFTYQNKKLTDLFKERLTLNFIELGLNINDYCKFMPWQPKPSFYGLMNHANVFLDTIGFSGFNTAMQGVECGVPIVTREGKFMRGRLASGILKRIGLHELIAQNEDDYINLAVKLASNNEYNQFVRNKIKENRHVLYGDLESVKGLEQFLENEYLKLKNTSFLPASSS